MGAMHTGMQRLRKVKVNPGQARPFLEMWLKQSSSGSDLYRNVFLKSVG
jgi:hypothetical protein